MHTWKLFLLVCLVVDAGFSTNSFLHEQSLKLMKPCWFFSSCQGYFCTYIVRSDTFLSNCLEKTLSWELQTFILYIFVLLTGIDVIYLSQLWSWRVWTWGMKREAIQWLYFLQDSQWKHDTFMVRVIFFVIFLASNTFQLGLKWYVTIIFRCPLFQQLVFGTLNYLTPA